jgi:ribosomal protein S18 acetylase RimI-like enzyme
MKILSLRKSHIDGLVQLESGSDIIYSRPIQSDIADIALFFAEQMQSTTEQWYTQEDIDWNISDHHRQDQFEQYIRDPQMYLEIVRSEWEIVGYIEARQNQTDNSRLHVWWVLVDSRFQWKWIAKNLYSHLQDHLRQNGYMKFTASTKKQNSVSIWFHISQWFSQIWETDEDFEFEKTI